MREGPPPLRAHLLGLVVGAVLAPVLLALGAAVVDGEGIGGFAELAPLAVIVLVTGAAIALPLSVAIERVWPRPSTIAGAALSYAVLGGGYAWIVQALLLGGGSWRLVPVGAVGAVLARAAGARYRPSRLPVMPHSRH